MYQTGASAPAFTCLRRAMFVVAVATIALALLGLTVPPAFGHTHPTPVERTEPAVVRVETSVQVDISLMEHDRHGKHIGLYQKRYEPVLNAGSGFAVDPSGVIVAAGGVITADTRQAEIYAVNHIFNDRYRNRAPLPADPKTTTTIRNDDPDDPLNSRLQRCYRANTADTTGGCVIATSRVIRVYPYVSSQARYGNLTASVLYPANGEAGDSPVSVLKVGASSMPTVNLGTSTAGTADFAALGFTEIPKEPPSDKGPMVNANGHLIGSGPEIEKDKFQPKLATAVAAGIWGGPVVGKTGVTTGFLQVRPPGPDGKQVPYMTDVGAIRKALAAARVEAHQGPTDAVFEAAMHNYKNHAYAAAIPSLEETLKLYPGHALAAQYLKTAKDRQGTAEDTTGRGSDVKGISVETGGMSLWTIAVIVGLLLVASLVALGAVRRGTLRPPALRRGGDDAATRSGEAPARPPPARREARTTPREPVDWPRAEAQATPAPGRAPVATARRPAPAAEEVGFCTECGRPVEREHKFCGYCGHKAR
jgi:hypothetical protein